MAVRCHCQCGRGNKTFRYDHDTYRHGSCRIVEPYRGLTDSCTTAPATRERRSQEDTSFSVHPKSVTMNLPTAASSGSVCLGDPCNRLYSETVMSTKSALHPYTDADLAADLNSLTFAEREAMEADIDGVNDAIKETPEFVSAKIVEMQGALGRLNPQQRQAWDRAIFYGRR